jgi:DNA-binding MarR family transcriptional regulator
MVSSKVFNRTDKSIAELKSAFPPKEIMQVAWTFTQAFNIYATSFAMIIRKKQLTISQWIALVVLFTSPEPVTPTRIKSFVPIESPSVSALLDRLEERKLILRKRSRQDRRKVYLYLTEGGYQILKETTLDTDQLVRTAWETIAPRKRRLLMGVAKELRNNCLSLFNIDYANADNVLNKFVEVASSEPYNKVMKPNREGKKISSVSTRKARRTSKVISRPK